MLLRNSRVLALQFLDVSLQPKDLAAQLRVFSAFELQQLPQLAGLALQLASLKLVLHAQLPNLAVQHALALALHRQPQLVHLPALRALHCSVPGPPLLYFRVQLCSSSAFLLVLGLESDVDFLEHAS